MTALISDELQMVGDTTVRARLDMIENEMDGEGSLTAAYLKHRMAELHISAIKLADACGVTRQYVYKVLRGEKPLSDDMIRSISAATDITDAELAYVSAIQTLRGVRHGSA